MRTFDPRGDQLEALLRHQARLLPDPAEAQAFGHHMVCPPPACLRLNPLVYQSELLRPFMQRTAESVTWCPDAFVLSEPGHRLGHCLEHALGAVYIQAKATTLAVEALAPQPGERVLDLAAAPGGKATHAAGLMKNTGLLVANEPSRRRLAALIGNLERCGAHNTVTTSASGTLLARWFHNFFDRVLLDAPCSGDGIVCKDQTVLGYWSIEDARRKSCEQIGLLRAAFHMLRPEGTMVYSTCSLSTEENEDVVLGLMRRYPDQVELRAVDRVETAPLPAGVASSYPDQLRRIVRLWPHHHQTEGGTVALLTKRGTTEWDRPLGDVSGWLEELGGDAMEGVESPPGEHVDARPGSNVEDAASQHAGTESPPREHVDARFGSRSGGAASQRAGTELGGRAEDAAGLADLPAPQDANALCRELESRWGFRVPVPQDQEVYAARRYLALRPRASAALEARLPHFVRAGMRAASLHKGHGYLTHQAVILWGRDLRERRLEVTWPQVQSLFRGDPIQLTERGVPPGDVVCTFGPWAVCRAQVDVGGATVRGYVPKAVRCPEIQRLTDV